MLKFVSKCRVLSLVAVSLASIGFSAYGSTDMAMVKRYFTLGEPVVTELASSVTPMKFSYVPPSTEAISLDTIINVGKVLWTIIQAGKPTVDLRTDFASALPLGTFTWHNLHDWQAPKSQSYDVSYKNGFGMEVVKFNYQINYTYGGRYEGKGRYLTNVVVIPSEIKVWWGFKLTANVQIPQLTNAGSKEDPIAGMQLVLNWKTGSILVHHQSSKSYYMSGEGAFTKFESL